MDRQAPVRQDLTDEWKQRGVASSQEFAILTNEIMHGTFALKVDEYKQVKALARENPRDHMTDIELILTMLAEATTTKLHRDRDSKGMAPLKKDAKDGGAVAQGVAVETDLGGRGNQKLDGLLVVEDHLGFLGIFAGRIHIHTQVAIFHGPAKSRSPRL